MKKENKILKQTLQDLLDIEQGIYPKSIKGGNKHDYEKRTPYMAGWNDALIEHMEKLCKVLDKNGVKVFDDRVDVNTTENRKKE